MILGELKAHNFDEKVECLRLSCHSRGVVRLAANTAMGNLVSKSPKGRVFDMSIVDRVVAMDSGHSQSSAGAALALFPQATRFGFHVGCENWGLDASRTVNLVSGPTNQEYLDTLIAARIITDAAAIGRGAAVDSDISDFITLLALPPIGGIDSRNIDVFYALIAAADPKLRARTIALGKGRMCPVNSSYFTHQMFAAEFFHEVMEELAPKIPR
jgi:hypothetical protein